MNYNQIILDASNHIGENLGSLPDYIPELKKVNPDQFGVHMSMVDQTEFEYGDSRIPFSMQSIGKVLSLALAYQKVGEDIWSRVGVEPSGNPFNSLVQLEYDQGIPRNPFINAGALVICDILISNCDSPKDELTQFLHKLAPGENYEIDTDVFGSEKSLGYRNKAMINFMKSFGNIKNNPDDVLDLYYHMCSYAVSCRQLSKLFLSFANDGVCPYGNNRILSTRETNRLNALMLTCGFYDESGEFSFKVGLPGKSGVGGGIIAIYPGKYAIAVWSPRLNAKGNSFRGMNFLEEFTNLTDETIF